MGMRTLQDAALHLMQPTFTVSIGSRQLFSGEFSALDAWIAARRRTTKRCSMCETVKPLAQFHAQRTGKHGRHSYCADCANGVRNLTRPTTSDARGYSTEQKHRWQLKTRYGLTPADYEQMLSEQDGNCAICGKTPEHPCVDHDHKSGAVRAILCHGCNIKLPAVEDADYRLKAIAYLERHNPATDAVSFISMFSGIEAASVAFGPLGWKPLCFAEIEKFPSAVLAHHYPDVPNVGDMSAHDWSQYRGKVDIVCGGPPCQAFSVAGLRGSLDDARGNLSLTYMKALHAISPRNAIIENVPGWLSTKDNAFGCFLAGLVGADDALPPPDGRRWPNAGMVAGPKGRAAWRILDAQYFGLAQRRKRVIVVADFGNGADPAAVLFEPESVPRHSPPSRETGERVAHPIAQSLTASGRGVERTGDTREGSSQDYESTTMVAVGVTGPISHALKAEGADASEDGTGRGTPIIAFAQNSRSEVRLQNGDGSIAGSLSSETGMNQTTYLALSVALRGREDGATAELGSDVAFTASSQANSYAWERDIYPTLNAQIPNDTSNIQYGVRLGSAVRRLTPRECERLQGFQFLCAPTYPGAWQDQSGRWWSPDYTLIPWRGKPADLCPDGPRYKVLGNSWAVPKFRWLGERIARLMPPC